MNTATATIEVPATLPTRILFRRDTEYRRINIEGTPNGKSVPAELACIHFGELKEETALLMRLAQRAYEAGNDAEGAMLERLMEKLDFIKEEAAETIGEQAYGD